MAATSGVAAHGAGPDIIYIGELYESISRSPPGIEARKLLIEHYIAVGNEWLEGALDEAKKLQALAPTDLDVVRFLKILEKVPEPPAPEKKAVKRIQASSVHSGGEPLKNLPFTAKPISKRGSKRSDFILGDSVDDLNDEQRNLVTGYRDIRAKATHVFANLLRLQTLQKKAGLPQSKNLAKVHLMADGSNGAVYSGMRPPASARSVARNIRDKPKEATNLVIADLEAMIQWVRAPYGTPSGASIDTIRDTLVKRRSAIDSTLPDALKFHCELGFMHVEHEHLERNYVNDETMLGDEIEDIAREDFYVTEDNYAWSMDELVQAIQANGGVLRNPLSREMFTPKDVKGILLHPTGKSLAALRVEQHEMSKGVRTETIIQMEKLSAILLADQSSDTLPSRKAVDEFLLYIATLPDFEQKAIEGLKCPATDSHTGQSYDWSIGEAVKDAKGNLVCFHKTGDFIRQAAAHLRKNRGVAPDTDEGNCSIM
ncbi:hypothetical protein J4E90_007558 [Alternaria incomplexa]|uniref:uncharacterized protein n=1 Tax=Alternaria incomplexa TaxID=1187928 RepID=UPI00221E710F|nr:uncharacterized protein J4E90_007558 [Alternaria incomplexa]KAI4910127.1 hypothetical protein J4E90_007558 [Alternaria incomplexa]